jgi:uncharacterized membrane protein
MSYLIKNSHFIVNHIPIAMLFFSFIFDLLAVILKKKDWHTAGFLTLIVGTAGAIATVLTGPDGVQEQRNALFHSHELFGDITMYFFIILTLLRLFFQYRKKIDIGKMPVYLFAALIGVALVTYTGHLGGKMVHRDMPSFNGQGGPGGPGTGNLNRQGRQGDPNAQGGQGTGANGNNPSNSDNNATPAP